ncbi:MAG: sugar phosphate isomerase/epimerase [Lachnospiraceae bacterium]|nr:sugar phosphate isomerase/epimerase [Lachnospiraceae bacterium]
MYILGRTQMIPTDSYEDAVRRIMAKGFDGVEIGIYNRAFEIREAFFEEDFPERMKVCMEENKVKAYSVGAHMDYTESQEKLQAIIKAVGVAAKLGAKQMIINGAIRKEELSFEEQWKKFIEDTKLICAEAEKQNVYLAMEFEPGFVADNTEKMLKAFAEINSPMLKVNADIGHVFLQDEEPMAALESCRGMIVHAHLENMAKGIHNHLVPWEGDMDLKAYLMKLKEVGFDGNASLDVYQYDYEAVAEKSVAYLKGVLRETEV